MVAANKQTHLSCYKFVVSRTANYWQNFHTEIHRSCMQDSRQRSLQSPANATIGLDHLRATLESFKDPIHYNIKNRNSLQNIQYSIFEKQRIKGIKGRTQLRCHILVSNKTKILSNDLNEDDWRTGKCDLNS